MSDPISHSPFMIRWNKYIKEILANKALIKECLQGYKFEKCNAFLMIKKIGKKKKHFTFEQISIIDNDEDYCMLYLYVNDESRPLCENQNDESLDLNDNYPLAIQLLIKILFHSLNWKQLAECKEFLQIFQSVCEERVWQGAVVPSRIETYDVAEQVLKMQKECLKTTATPLLTRRNALYSKC
ncbi:MAG: hypothetical protein OEY79_00910 [Anaplasmataceae bacterium]|nr:hypothetical protein [Anaplasmataceae bacterium]